MNLPPSPRQAESSSEGARLLQIVRELAHELRPRAGEVDHLTLDHGLERDFGLDSLARVELLVRVDREMGVRLAEAAFAEAETVRDLLRLMGSKGFAEDSVPLETTPEKEAEFESPPQTLATLIDLLDWHADRHGDQVHITLYVEGEHTEEITYRMLQAEAQSLAAGLLSQGVSIGDRVAVMLPTGRAFLAAFYGALYAGCVPVPLYPPVRPSQIEDHMRRIAGIVANAGTVMLVTDDRARLLGHLLKAQCASLRGVTTVAELSRHGAAPILPTVGPQDIAFLQYTSGSTGNPKGVVLTHANLMANLKAMKQASGVTAQDIFVSWLPLYHDMGLIGACMGSLYIGFRLVLMSPLAFLARPALWLWRIHLHRGTVSAAPNFAYELCANKLDERDLNGLDLSCWRLAYNGAEPVSASTIERFGARLLPYGLNPEGMTPVYGLAESSVGLAFPPLGRGPWIDRVDRLVLSRLGIARPVMDDDAHAQRFVSCGRPLPGHAIRIVDANGLGLAERTQGRVQFQGPSATSGYFRNPEATQRLMEGEWLNTGDLGYLAEGELFLTGREKDVIIRGGHNIHPQELEEAVNQLVGVRRGGVTVFPATDAGTGTERLVVLAEMREEGDAGTRGRIEKEINRLAIDLIGMPADDIVLAPPRTVLKTSSGKIRRAACRELYERGELMSGRSAPWRQWLRLALTGVVASVRRRVSHGVGWMWSVWAWMVFGCIVPFAWSMIVVLPTLRLRRRFARASARLVLSLTGLMPRVEGLPHLAGRDPVIVAVNHASYLDALILTAVLPPRFAYVAKQELLRKPFAGIPLRRLACTFVERFDSARGAEDTRELEARARAGDSLIFFPEGTFRSEPGLLPFRLGAFVVAARVGMSVVPITLSGTRALLPGEIVWPRFSKLQVRIGAPVSAQGDDWQAALQLHEVVRGEMLKQMEEHEAVADRYH
ncbi:MAG: AMP-binding protein [Desulfurivibrio sp.]|nr:AMP-binding protein [Desulfurivibrio sp.]MBU4119414.1 AMP-binding protein [Pseudomonadota bacterium]